MEIFKQIIFEWAPALLFIANTIWGAYMLFKRNKPEIVKIESETNSENASAVESYARATQIYSDELARVNEQIRILIEKNTEKDKIIMEQRITITEVTDWAERLVYQVKSMGAVPVAFKTEAKLAPHIMPADLKNEKPTK